MTEKNGEKNGEKKNGGKKRKEKKKIMMKIVATNVVASRPPNGDRLQRRPLVPIFKAVVKTTPDVMRITKDELTVSETSEAKLSGFEKALISNSQIWRQKKKKSIKILPLALLRDQMKARS